MIPAEFSSLPLSTKLFIVLLFMKKIPKDL